MFHLVIIVTINFQIKYSIVVKFYEIFYFKHNLCSLVWLYLETIFIILSTLKDWRYIVFLLFFLFHRINARWYKKYRFGELYRFSFLFTAEIYNTAYQNNYEFEIRPRCEKCTYHWHLATGDQRKQWITTL